MYGFGAVGRADGVDGVEGPARGPAVQRPRQRPDGADHGGGGVGPRRGDDPGGEGGGVEAVVDGQDQVLLQGPGQGRVGPSAGHHPQVVGGVIQVGVGLDRIAARGQAVQGGHQGRAWPRSAGSGRAGRRRRRDPTAVGIPQAAPSAETAVRRRVMGPAALGHAGDGRERAPAARGGVGTGRADLGREASARALASPGREPSSRSCHTSSRLRCAASSVAEYWR